MAKLNKWQRGLNNVLKQLKDGTYDFDCTPKELYDYYYWKMVADEEEMYLDDADRWWKKIDKLEMYLHI